MADDVADDDADGRRRRTRSRRTSRRPPTRRRWRPGSAPRCSRPRDGGDRRRQQRPLQALGDLVLLLERPRVAERQRGAVRDLDGEVEVVVVEQPVALGRQDEHAERRAPRPRSARRRSSATRSCAAIVAARRGRSPPLRGAVDDVRRVAAGGPRRRRSDRRRPGPPPSTRSGRSRRNAASSLGGDAVPVGHGDVLDGAARAEQSR